MRETAIVRRWGDCEQLRYLFFKKLFSLTRDLQRQVVEKYDQTLGKAI